MDRKKPENPKSNKAIVGLYIYDNTVIEKIDTLKPSARGEYEITDLNNLYIKEAYVGKSIVLKRFRARAKGRASGIKKPYSNLTIILSENNKEELHGSKS